MKNIIFLFFIGLLVLASCNKEVLNKVPLSIISDNALWNDQTLIDSYLTQQYAAMQILNFEAQNFDWNGGEQWLDLFAPNEVSDESMAIWNDGINDQGYHWKVGGLTITGGLLEWWELGYQVIRALNVFIERVSTSPVDASFKKVRVAEARFLRAYNYFSMVKRYGGVPLITKAQQTTDSKESLYPKRDTEQAIYDFVVSEMDAIATDLPDHTAPGDWGRPSKYAAIALKSRAALYAGSIAQFGTVQLNGVIGIDPSKKTAYYQAAYDAAKQIINSNNFALYNALPDKTMNFRNLFLVKQNSEVIWVRTHTYTDYYSGGNGWGWDFFLCPLPEDGWGDGNCDGPYLEMAEEFEHIDGTSGKLDRTAIQQGLWTTESLWANKDPRFFATLYTQDTPWRIGGKIDYHYGILKPDGSVQTSGSYNNIMALGICSPRRLNNWRSTGFGVLKLLDESHDNTGSRSTSGTDLIIFRYGEILLNLAEAAFELGKTGDALDAINQIRDRAGIARLAAIDRDKIRHERKVELAFEDHRYWDVRRWRTAVNDLTKPGSGIDYILEPTSGKYKLTISENIDGTSTPPVFLPQNYYLPITVARTGNNPSLVENPGYH